MSNKYTFSVIGGDCRQVAIIKNLLENGHNVKAFAINAPFTGISGAEISSSLDKAIEDCNFLLLPLPVSRDKINLNLVSSPNIIPLNDIIKACLKNKDIVIIGGMIPQDFFETVKKADIDVIDFYNIESLQQKNALPSAEGAIMVAMENTDCVVEGMSVLISGYGRIGKILAKKLHALGADVSVAARRDEVLCEITMNGFKAINTANVNDMAKAVQENKVIFNTIPKQIFSRQIIDGCQNSPLYIEVASSPGGIDIPFARNNEIQMIFAPSLPGKYAPASAGTYIFEAIIDILAQRGINI